MKKFERTFLVGFYTILTNVQKLFNILDLFALITDLVFMLEKVP